MRKITDSEILSITRLLQMETNGLAIAKAGLRMIGDDELRKLAETGISNSEARIKGLQQFITENNIVPSREVQ